MDFDARLDKAIRRGRRIGSAREREAAEKMLSEEELKRLYSEYRLQLSEHIDTCLNKLANHFPGFRFESLVGEKGWGAEIRRDDLDLKGGERSNLFSRLLMAISPLTDYHVLELVAKGTVRNKEIYNRTHFRPLAEADADSFAEMIDLWVLEYAEQFAGT